METFKTIAQIIYYLALRAYPNNRWNPITPLRSCIYF